MGNTWDLPSFGPCFLFCLGTFSLSSWFSRKDEFVLHSEKQGALCNNIESGNVWGVLKMRDPQVTIVFNTAWMIWVTHHNFRNLRMKFHDIWSYMFHVRNMCQHWGLIFWIYVGKYIPYMEHMEHNGAYEQNVFTKKRARSEYDSWLIASREPKKNDEKPHRSVNIPSQATDALLALPPFFSRPWKLTSGCFRKEELIPAVMKNIVYLIRSVISYLFLFRKKREPHYPLTWLLETFWIPKCCETCDFPTAILNSMEVLVRGEFPAPEGTSPHWFSLFM